MNIPNEITRYNMIWLVPCDFSSTFIQEKGWATTTTESRACRTSLSWCHSDVVGVQGKLISEFVPFKWRKVEKSWDFWVIVSIDCWNMLKWYWKCPSIWLLWIYSLFQWDKSETRKKNISKLVWASVRQPLAISHRTIAEVWKVYKGLAKQEPRMQGRSLTSSESRAILFRRKLPLARGIPQIHNLLQLDFLGLNLWNPIIWIRGDIITW